MDKKSFIMYKDIKVQIDALSDDEAGQLFKAIYEYQVNNQEKELSPVTAMVFLFIKQQFARDHEKYEVRVNNSRINGSKGGRPKLENNPENPVGYNKTESVKKEPRKGDTVNVTDTVNDNVTVKDNDNKEGNKSPKKESKNKYGEYKHVLLTEKQFIQLTIDYHADKANEMVKNLDEYLEMNNKSYKNHNLVMRKWEGKITPKVKSVVKRETAEEKYNRMAKELL